MALRSQILTSSLPLLPTHSFTRPTLIQALRTIKPDITSPESVVDTLFGPGSVGASKALVERWEEEGLKAMSTPVQGEEEGKKDLEGVLRRRIEYSARVGDHLVEAYANLSTPSSTPSIPLPSLPILRTLLSSIKLPPSYVPPSSPLSSTASTQSANASSILDQLSSMTGHRLPLLSVNPLGPIAYAWRIADEALHLSEQRGKRPGAVRRGYWNEPTGPGPEWYTKRIGLSLVYLSSESPLLQPSPSPNTHLAQALASLQTNLNRYHSILSSLENTESNLGDTAGFVDFVARSIGGIAKSRYM